MAQMIRKQVYIEPRQEAILKRLARMRGVSEAELIRESIDRQASGSQLQSAQLDPAAWEEAYQFMVALHARGALPEQGRKWKREELYEERLNRYGRRSD
jgi:hypothetical protein